MNVKLIEKSFQNLTIRITSEKEPWFLAHDIFNALGHSNGQKALYNRVNEVDRQKVRIEGWNSMRVIVSVKGAFAITSGLAWESAKQFEDWLVSWLPASLLPDGITAPAPAKQRNHTQLIQVGNETIGDGVVQTVNARELHAFLEVGKDFSTWIRDRISKYEFIEGVDFITDEILSSPVSGSSKSRQQRAKEYFLTLDMAKELSMVERNEKGKEARRYFIECERKANQVSEQKALPSNYVEALEHLVKSEKEKARLSQERDEAVRTKARISSSREASVMAQLGHVKRENVQLKEQLGIGAKHKSVKGAGLDTYYTDKDGKRRSTANTLKVLAIEAGVGDDIIKVEDPNFGAVKAYPIAIIDKFKQGILGG